MSCLTANNRITIAKPFASLPALGDLPEIRGPDPSVSSLSSDLSPSVVSGCIDLSEGCLVTNVVKDTNQLVYMISPIQDPSEDSTQVENVIRYDMGIMRDRTFTLYDPCNIAYLDCSIHASFELYALIAITPSLLTLQNLTEMVERDNHRQQQQLDEIGGCYPRSLDFSSPFFTNPEYELVVLHSDHFLPQGAVLTVYNRETETQRDYVLATDGHLRESVNITSPRLPPFRHGSANRFPLFQLNVFLVILNADIKFRHYFELIQHSPPSNPPPDDVITLMNLTMKLADLLYWMPTAPTKGSVGQEIVKQMAATRRQFKRHLSKLVKSGSSEEEDIDIKADPYEKRRKLQRIREMHEWCDSVDLETRKAYGRSIMFRHDPDDDPALFGDAFPLNDSHLYSESGAIEDWQRGISSSG